MDPDVLPLDSRTSLREARVRLAKKRAAGVLLRIGRRWGIVRWTTLRRALELRLGHRPLDDVAQVGLPSVTLWDSEIRVRRLFYAGAPAVVVRGGERSLGVIWPEACRPPTAPELSLAYRLESLLGSQALTFLREVGAVAEQRGWTAWAVGGFVRDIFRAHPSLDLDLTVEGDGVAFARSLARRFGGEIARRSQFLTARVLLPGGRKLDVATARRERYGKPGRLPEVRAANILQDLARRDFTFNSLALCLAPGRFGEVLDPQGGARDLRDGLVRILHPLSFVEDPTRIFRACRYAGRFGFRLERGTAHLIRRAVGMGAFPAVTGRRWYAEISLIALERDPAPALLLLGRVGAYRLIHPRFCLGRGTGERLARVKETLDWAEGMGLRLVEEERGGLFLTALTAHLPPRTFGSILERLALPHLKAHTIHRAREEAAPLLAEVENSPEWSALYFRLRKLPRLVTLWALAQGGWTLARERLRRAAVEFPGVIPLLSGHDLVALGLRPGPLFRKILDRSLAAQLDGQIQTRDEALSFARQQFPGAPRRGP